MTPYFRCTVQNGFVIEKSVNRKFIYPFNSIYNLLLALCLASLFNTRVFCNSSVDQLHPYPLFALQWVPFPIHLQISTSAPKTLPTLLQHISLPQALPRLKMIVAKFLPYSSPSRFDLQLSVTVSLSLQCVNIPLQGPDLKLVN
jgi:hypothetical protein